MKIIYLLVVIAFLGISASTAFADGVDPVVFTKGCGGKGQPACDAVILTSVNTPTTVSEQFSCVLGNCTATDDVINATGVAINSFTLVWDTLNGTLTYSCQEGGFFTCSPVEGTTNAFTFTGASLCSDENDFVEDTFVGDGDDCGVVIGLNATTSEVSDGEVVTGTGTFSNSISAPEPSSALLLVFGLMAGLVSLKSLRTSLSYRNIGS